MSLAASLRKRLKGALRVALFLSCVNLLGTALYLPRARAAAEKFAVTRGLQVLTQLGPLAGESEQAMSINGQRMFLASRVTTLPLDEVLELFEQDCRANSGGLAEALGKLPAQLHGADIPEQLRDPSRWLTLRQQDGPAGQVTCFVRSDSPGKMKGFLARLAAFAKSGDLSELGDARYVVAERDEAAKLTHVLATWTQGQFNPLQMFPPSGDAPGADSSVVPRPENSVRVLSAETPDRPYALRIYDSPRPPAEILSYYTREMRVRGWSLLEVSGATGVELARAARTFTKDGRAVIVVVNTTPEERSGVNLIELGSQGFAAARAEYSP